MSLSINYVFKISNRGTLSIVLFPLFIVDFEQIYELVPVSLPLTLSMFLLPMLHYGHWTKNKVFY